MTNIVPIVKEIEEEYGGSVRNAPIDDKRLIKIRKMLSYNGQDNLLNKKISFDLGKAQEILDQAQLTKKRISEVLGIKAFQLQRAIGLGILDDTQWRRKYFQNKAPKYRLFKDDICIAEGTTHQIAHEIHISINSVRYLYSDRYKNTNKENKYRLVKVTDSEMENQS